MFMGYRDKHSFSPLALPIIFFLTAIALGAVLLHQPFSNRDEAMPWIDALFMSTSATCVTGLSVVDTGSGLSAVGQVVILVLIQFGGLGIMTFTSLAFYLLNNRVSLTDRIAVGQSLLHDSRFHLGRFLVQIVIATAIIELVGALLLHFADPQGFSTFSALFHAVSAFCNAGFSLFSDSMMHYRANIGVNLIMMTLIILGGLGFAVLVELRHLLVSRVRGDRSARRMSWQSMVVLQTSCFLVVVGALSIYVAEVVNFRGYLGSGEAGLAALFQSVNCRTAGFNSVDLGKLTDVSLLFMAVLMLIGGASGSCAGGIKVTTVRILWAFIVAQLKGRKQVIVGRYAIDEGSVNRALALLFFSLVIVFISLVLLSFTEGGDISHSQARGRLLEILFEVVSAFGTVGLSTGLTGELSVFGKLLIAVLMFIGRLGPLMFLVVLQNMRTKIHYSLPEEKLPIG